MISYPFAAPSTIPKGVSVAVFPFREVGVFLSARWVELSLIINELTSVCPATEA